jgi:hypothetical protein
VKHISWVEWFEAFSDQYRWSVEHRAFAVETFFITMVSLL